MAVPSQQHLLLWRWARKWPLLRRRFRGITLFAQRHDAGTRLAGGPLHMDWKVPGAGQARDELLLLA